MTHYENQPTPPPDSDRDDVDPPKPDAVASDDNETEFATLTVPDPTPNDPPQPDGPAPIEPDPLSKATAVSRRDVRLQRDLLPPSAGAGMTEEKSLIEDKANPDDPDDDGIKGLELNNLQHPKEVVKSAEHPVREPPEPLPDPHSEPSV